MKKVKLTGYAITKYTRTMEVPDDEVAELISDEETIQCNLEDQDDDREVVGWDNLKAEIVG